MRLLVVAVIAFAVAACASIGRPTGGDKDETPPVYVRSNPEPGTKNFNKDRIEVFFDENIKIEDASNKVVVSPAQQQQPRVIANGKKLTVTLQDTLIPDQTYTIDFSDAIRDLNEGNILDGFVIDFATGDSIDSLRISGLVLQASNLEPAQGMLVGAYRNYADSAVKTIRVERIAKTNQLGQFTLRNLKDDNYRVFAINDVNRDFHWDRSEDIAFYNAPIRPWTENFTVTDTLRASNGADSVATRPGIRYLPNDILLTWFNEDYKQQYLKEYSREEPNLIKMQFGAPSDTFPILKIVNGENEGKKIGDYAKINYSATRDTLEFWISDSTIIKQDSLLIATTYLKTDSTDNLSWTTDTLRFFYRMSRAKQKELEQLQKQKEQKEKKRQDKIKEWLETGDSALLADTMPEVEQIEFLTVKATTGSSQDYHRPVRLQVSEPLQVFDTTAVKLEWQEDTIWHQLDLVSVMPDTTGKIMEYVINRQWDYETKYRLTIDSAAMTGIYDHWNDAFKHEFTVKKAEDYSTIIFDIPNKPYLPEIPFDWSTLETFDSIPANLPDSISLQLSDSITLQFNDSTAQLLNDSISLQLRDSITVQSNDSTTQQSINHNDSISTLDSLDTLIPELGIINSDAPAIIVELLTQNEAVVAQQKVVDGKARFDFISPGNYYARAFIDFNGNGEWDTGNISEWRQPEDVFYYPKKITLKQNWDMSQTWDLFETPLELQKPLDIKKNKPKTKDGKNVKPTEEEEEEDQFNNNYFYGGGYDPSSQYNNAGNRTNTLR